MSRERVPAALRGVFFCVTHFGGHCFLSLQAHIICPLLRKLQHKDRIFYAELLFAFFLIFHFFNIILYSFEKMFRLQKPIPQFHQQKPSQRNSIR